jgi:hypothetical protein
MLPESIKFLIVAREKAGAVAAILRRINPGERADENSTFVLEEAQPGRGQLSALFKGGLAAGSIFLCIAFFMSLMLVYLFINWIPLLLRQAGLPLEHALMGTIIFNLAGIIGSIVCTQLIDRNVGRPIVILIGAYSRLDTLFLTMPIAWKGTLAQYAGRLHRLHDAKREVIIYDYVDIRVPALARMAAKRRIGYQAIGYKILGTRDLFSGQLVATGTSKAVLD